MLILGFGNKARQGKDTAAEAVQDYYRSKSEAIFRNYGREKAITVGIFKFATALYREVNDFLGTYDGKCWLVGQASSVYFPEWVVPEKNPTFSELAPRGKHPKMLQWWGTEYRRAQDPDYWVNKMFDSVPENIDIALVSDVRFPNEGDGILKRGGYNTNVQRLYENGEAYFAKDRPIDHPSEVALDGYNWDAYIKSKSAAMTAQQAITVAEYFKVLGPNERTKS